MTGRLIVSLLILVLVLGTVPAAAAQQDALGPSPQLERLMPSGDVFPVGTVGFTLPLGTRATVCPGVVHRWTNVRASLGRAFFLPETTGSVGVVMRSFATPRAAQRALRSFHRRHVVACGEFDADGVRVTHRERRSPFPRAGDARRAFSSVNGSGRDRLITENAMFRFGRIMVQVAYTSAPGDEPRAVWRAAMRSIIDEAE